MRAHPNCRPQITGPYSDELEGVSCPSASSCVAVGYYQAKGGSQQTLVETLANGTWSVTTSPNRGSGDNSSPACRALSRAPAWPLVHTRAAAPPGPWQKSCSAGSWVLTTTPDTGSGSNVLNAVSCPSVGACTAVGYFDNGTVDRALAESLSASVWAVMPVQDQGTGLNELNGISCPATGSCVSVGTYRTAAGVNQDLIETLVAGTWSVHHPSPDANGANNELAAISCTSLTSCMAVGHYNSKGVAQSLAIALAHGAWTVVQSPDKGKSTNQLAGVSCSAGATLECAGVGYFNDLISGFADVAAQALAQMWSAGTWSLMTAADAMVSDVSANDVSCPSASSCVAVGTLVDPAGTHEVFIEDLANGTWSMVPGPGPSPTTNSLGGVSCPSATSCVAVGFYATAKTGQALIETLSGGTWAVTPSPDQGTGYNQLNGVSCAGVGACVAVGYYSGAGGARALIETLANGFVDFDPEPRVDRRLELFAGRFLLVAHLMRGGGLRVQRDRPAYVGGNPGQRGLDRRQ